MGHPFTRLLRDPYLIINAPASANADILFLLEGGLEETCDLTTGFGLDDRGASSFGTIASKSSLTCSFIGGLQIGGKAFLFAFALTP